MNLVWWFRSFPNEPGRVVSKTRLRHDVSGPRVYGYYREDGQWVPPKPHYRGGCGTYHFWNGERCVDARDGR